MSCFSASSKTCLLKGRAIDKGGSVAGHIRRIRFCLRANKNNQMLICFFKCSFVFQNVTSILIRTLLRRSLNAVYKIDSLFLSILFVSKIV